MGKKKRKKRRKLNYTKAEFQQIFCSKCMLCPSKTDPTFCFEQVYKQNPKLFVRVIFNRLIQLNKWIFESGEADIKGFDESIEYIFKNAFCSSGFCGGKHHNGCEMITGCLMAFRAQMRGKPKINLNMAAPQGKKNKKKNKKNRYVAKAYPTFFCNEPFKSEIEVLLNEDNNFKQNKATKSTGLPKEFISGAAASSESQIPGSPGRW